MVVFLLIPMAKYIINIPERNLLFALEHYYYILCSVCMHKSRYVSWYGRGAFIQGIVSEEKSSGYQRRRV